MRFLFAPDTGAGAGPTPSGAAPTPPTAPVEPSPAPVAEIEADALIDGDGIEEGKKYRISAGKLKELNEARKAFRSRGIDPAQIPALIERWEQLEGYVAQQKPPEPEKPAATPEEAAKRTEARKLFYELFPEFQDVEKTVKALQEVSGREDARVRGLYVASHDHVAETLSDMHVELNADQINDVEDLILKRIRSDPQKAAKYFYGPNALRVVTSELKDVLAHLGHKSGASRSADAALEAGKRRTLQTVPPRIQGSVPAPGGQGPPAIDPANPMASARKNALAFLRSANKE